MTHISFPARRSAIVTTLVTACFVCGCQQYGEVSPKCYEFATALYSVCNRKDADRLEMIDKAIDDAVTAKELPADEAADLKEIIQQANDGKWPAAMLDCRTLMSEQNVST